MTEMFESGTGRDDRSHWQDRYRERGAERDRAPSSWVVDRCLSLPRSALFLDVAGGSGRHAAALAGDGRSVVLMDFIFAAVRAAVMRDPHIGGVVADVQACPLRAASVDAIVCVSFLDRSLFGVLATLLRSGGTLVYETFTREHLEVVARGRARGPRNPEYLLRPGELRELVLPLDVREYDERLVIDDAGERHVARVLATKQ
jgi:SAM-dependent methyltransferase